VTDAAPPAERQRRRRLWPWIVGGILAVVLALVAIVVVPILLATPQGSSGQARVDGYPTSVTATGDDERTRTLTVATPDGDAPELDSVSAGDRLVVTGDGYDGSRGLYVAVCAIPEQLDGKPGPCLGGVGSQAVEEFEEGVVQYAASNWINEAFAWRLFGARSFDDGEAGTFTAYIELPPAADENVDCREVECGLYTRNDHTASADRVQDLYVPLRWVG